MGTVSFTGLSSVADRTIFTDRGPIVKPVLELSTGSDLQVLNQEEIRIPSGSFTSVDEGKNLVISGSPSGRNDGTFPVKQVKNSTDLVLSETNFDTSDFDQTSQTIIALAIDLQKKYSDHLVEPTVHGTDDTVNVLSGLVITSFNTAVSVLNDLKAQFNAHIIDITGDPQVHLEVDIENTIFFPDAQNDDLESTLALVNEIRKKYSNHRQNALYHPEVDLNNFVAVEKAFVVTGIFPGPLTGPFSWILEDPRVGEFATLSDDVEVRVNSVMVGVEAVFGLLGAVVLDAKPAPADDVEVDYSFLNNPLLIFSGLNFPGFCLNQVGNHATCGLPQAQYPSRSFLLDPFNVPNPHGVASPFAPLLIGWRYKGYERAYTASLNDPNLLRLNSPVGKRLFPVLDTSISETVISYDADTLPQDAEDPWTFEGQGILFLESDGSELTIIDENEETGTENRPPFFTHKIDLSFPNIVSAAFRAFVNKDETSTDGVFTGVSFGVSDGERVAVIGFIETEATNLSSSITLANDLKKKFNLHIIEPTIHTFDDPDSAINLTNATNLVQLLIVVNTLKANFNAHIIKTPQHEIVDSVNEVISPDAGDQFSDEISLAQVITLVNEIKDKYNAHRLQVITLIQVHQENDDINDVPLVKQVGVLTNRGPKEFQENWNSFSVDWEVLTSYRFSRDATGDISVFLSAVPTAIFSALASELPSISDLNGMFDPVQQIFFGTIGKETKSDSKWAFNRTISNPLDANQIEDNKSVTYDGSVLPDLSTTTPWINVGQGGLSEVDPSDRLRVDSTASANTEDLDALGLSSGSYIGYLRIEPIISSESTAIVEFTTQIDFFTFGVDNKSVGVFIEDQNLSVHLLFLQFSPSPASITSSLEPFPMINGDELIVSIDGATPITIVFAATDITAALIVTAINATVGIPATFASEVSGKVVLTTLTSGSSSTIRVVGGSAVPKFGFIEGTFAGSDSSPEPRVSYFGADTPDNDIPIWERVGDQTEEMLGRTLRITDASTTDFLLYNNSDPLVTGPVLGAIIDWKLDVKLAVVSYTAADQFISTIPFTNVKFAGAFVNLDEGPDGKNLELHLSVDSVDNKYLTIVSFGLGVFKIVFQMAFNWDDGAVHTYNVFVNKNIGGANVFVLIDGISVGNFSYADLNVGIVGPSITFGSGAAPVGGVDIQTAQSVIDWHSVAVFKDSKLADPDTFARRRFIGIYRGGDPTVISSYALHQIDWTLPNTYRIVRNPVDSVSVFVDPSSIPVISVNYDALRLPPASASFFNGITNGLPIVAFGSFNPQEISRVRWDRVDYSLGKIISNNRIVPRHHVLNQANPIASPDHLFTQLAHQHFGTNVESEGTPDETEVVANDDPLIDSFTVLGEGTAPVPMTQNMESRGGLQKNLTQTQTIDPATLIDIDGFISNFEDDPVNGIVSSRAIDLATSITLVNELKQKYNLHRTTYRVHVNNDKENVVTGPNATDLATAIILANDVKAQYELHRIEPDPLPAGAHVNLDTINVVTAPDATDLATLLTLLNDVRAVYESHRRPLVAFVNDLKAKFNAHIIRGPSEFIHIRADEINPVILPDAIDLNSAILLINDIRGKFNRHLIEEDPAAVLLDVHIVPDAVNTSTAPIATGYSSALILATELKTNFDAHIPDLTFHTTADTLNSTVIFVSASVIQDVHRSSTVIRLDPPSRVLYESMNFYQFPTGDAGHLSPFSDDETLSWGTIKHAGNHILSYTADVLPENDDEFSVINLANDIKAKYNAHLVEAGVHLVNDTINDVTSPNATDLVSAITLINEIKVDFNAHRTEAGIHIADDTVNVVVSVDATEISTALALVNEIRFRFEVHRAAIPFHGSVTDLVTLSADLDTSYATHIASGAFHTAPDGTNTTSTTPVDLATSILFLNEMKAAFNAHLIFAAAHPVLDTENTVISTDATDFVSATILSAELKQKFNPHLLQGLPLGIVHVLNDTVNASTAALVSGDTVNQIAVQNAPPVADKGWRLFTEGPGSEVISLETVSGREVLRYGTDATGANTVYRNDSPLPDSRNNFELTVTLKVNAAPFSSNFDSRIYAGFLSSIEGGVSAAIGFEALNSIPYVKIHDVNSGKAMYRIPFNWADGNFHSFKLVRDIKTNSIGLVVVS